MEFRKPTINDEKYFYLAVKHINFEECNNIHKLYQHNNF